LICLLVLWPLVSMGETGEAREQRSEGRTRSPRGPAVALTLGLSAGVLLVRGNEYVGDEGGLGMISGWVGATVHPRPASASWFMGAGLEIGGVYAPESRGGHLLAMEFVPEVRGGLALLGSPFWEFFPHLELYVLSGFRVPNVVRGSALRLGAGISIPAFGAAQFESFGRNCPPFFPWMVEVIYDVSDVPETSIRVGYHF
jgi:hypothetical protein